MLIQGDGNTPMAGVVWKWEDAATLILLDDRRAMESNKISDRTDWLSDEQQELRRSREVYPVRGMADAHYLRGQYSRVYHHRELRPTNRKRYSLLVDPWRQDWYESFDYLGNDW